MKGASLSSEAADKHAETDELPLRAWTYISSIDGEDWGRIMLICGPAYVSTISRKLMIPGLRVAYKVVAAALPYQNVARTR